MQKKGHFMTTSSGPKKKKPAKKAAAKKVAAPKTNTKKIVTGAVIGGALGCIAAAVVASRKRKPKGFAESCKEFVADKAQDIIKTVKKKLK
jgi:hypothetical protein